MYLDFFNLKEAPFRLSPDPGFLFLSKQHARAKAYMESTIWFTDGFVVITGEIGAGKTTLIESFVAELDDDVLCARVSQTQITPVSFLQAVLADFGFKPFKMRKAELLDTLNMFLIDQYKEDKKVVLIIDEAQNLSKRVLEEIRLLSGVETHKDKCLRIILAGQPELNDTLDSPDMQQLAQRIRLRFHLSALTKAETKAYIEHRLEVAGGLGSKLFESQTFPVVFRYTGGIPRLVNTLCDTALLCAFADDRHQVTDEILQTALEELQWEEYAARTNRFSTSFAGIPTVTGERFGKLLVATDGKTISEYALPNGRLIIGRTADNDLQIDSKYVSRHHAQIISNEKYSIIEDLNSTNGIYVKSQRIKKRRLADGEVVRIGKHEIMYIDERNLPKTA